MKAKMIFFALGFGILLSLILCWAAAFLLRVQEIDLIEEYVWKDGDRYIRVAEYHRPATSYHVLSLADKYDMARLQTRHNVPRLVDVSSRYIDLSSDGRVSVDARGWPLRCLYSITLGAVTKAVIGGIPIETAEADSFSNDVRLQSATIPFRPIVSGFVINGLAFSAAVFALVLIRQRSVTWYPRVTMRSLVLGAIAAAIGGALLTVIISWLAAIYIDESFRHNDHCDAEATVSEFRDYRNWLVTRQCETGATRWRSSWFGSEETMPAFNGGVITSQTDPGSILPRWTDSLRPSGVNGGDRIADARGWPFLALGACFEVDEADETLSIARVRWGVLLENVRYIDHADNARIIPLRPIPYGFICNTIIYGFALYVFAIATIWPALRGKMLLMQGRCVLCAYNLRGSVASGCPECGWNRPKGEEMEAAPDSDADAARD